MGAVLEDQRDCSADGEVQITTVTLKKSLINHLKVMSGIPVAPQFATEDTVG